jgi:hypothetical protein
LVIGSFTNPKIHIGVFKKREDAQKSLKEMDLEYGNRFRTIRAVALHLGYQLRDKNKEGNFRYFLLEGAIGDCGR